VTGRQRERTGAGKGSGGKFRNRDMPGVLTVDMAVTEALRSRVRANPRAVTALLTLVGYALVLNAFERVVPIYPNIGEETVRLLSTVISVINAATLIALLAGVYFIKQREIARHRVAMVTAVALELGFLLLYVTKVGGGGELAITATGLVKNVYLVILAVHLVCSALAVPFVVYALSLGLTHSPAELANTSHARVGRAAAAVWGVSLALGIVTHLMLRFAGSELHTVGMALVPV
jgi:putative membrane protein